MRSISGTPKKVCRIAAIEFTTRIPPSTQNSGRTRVHDGLIARQA